MRRRRTGTRTVAKDKHIISIKFPSEIVDHVVSYLWGNHTSLGRCALVCRVWSAIVRPYIFRRITLDGVRGGTKLKELEKMLDANPAMCYWIRELRMEFHASTMWDLWYPRPGYTPPPIIEKLTKLHTITLFHIHIGSQFLDPEMQANLAQNLVKYHSVRSLCLERCFIDPRTVALFVSFLPSLLSLTLSTTSSWFHWNYDEYKSPRGGRLPSLTSLTLDTNWPFHSILPPESMQRLKSLDIQRMAGRARLKFITKNVGPALHTLRIDFWGPSHGGCLDRWITIENVLGHWDLGRLKGLRKVHLGPCLGAKYNNVVTAFLSKLSVLPIDEITLEVAFDYMEDLKPLAHKEMNQGFHKPAFEHLKSVRFVYTGCLGLKKVHDRLKQVFSSLEARCIELELLRIK